MIVGHETTDTETIHSVCRYCTCIICGTIQYGQPECGTIQYGYGECGTVQYSYENVFHLENRVNLYFKVICYAAIIQKNNCLFDEEYFKSISSKNNFNIQTCI